MDFWLTGIMDLKKMVVVEDNPCPIIKIILNN